MEMKEKEIDSYITAVCKSHGILDSDGKLNSILCPYVMEYARLYKDGTLSYNDIKRSIINATKQSVISSDITIRIIAAIVLSHVVALADIPIEPATDEQMDLAHDMIKEGLYKV